MNKDKTIIITGAFGFLGRAVLAECLAQGYNLGLIDYAPIPDALFADDEDKVFAVGGCDLSDAAQAEEAVKKIVDHFGQVNGLLNIAGGFRWESFLDNNLDSWEALFKLNVKTAISTTKAVAPYMVSNGSGAIVCVSAAASAKADMGMGPYAASKAGVSRFVESLAQELKSSNVRINAVAPSIIDTPVNRKDMPDANYADWVPPAELAKVMLYLLSDDAKVITGVTLPVTNKT